jgi:hypothetical protein
MTTISKILVALMMIGLSVLACNLPVKGSANPPSEPTIISSLPVNPQNPSPTLAPLDPAAPTVQYKITEAQLTDLLTKEVSSQSQPVLENPQATLRNGQIQITGQSKQSILTVDVLIVMVPEVDANGELTVKVTTAKFGPVEAPESTKGMLATSINRQLQSALGLKDAKVRIQSVSISDGVMTVTGVKAQ